jgi:hypothetical protein
VATTSGDAFDGGDQLWGVGWIPDLDVVVQDDAVFVVNDLGLVTELDGLTPAWSNPAGCHQ